MTDSYELKRAALYNGLTALIGHMDEHADAYTKKTDRCYKCKKLAKYITHTNKNGKVMKSARFTCKEHHYTH